MEDLLFSFRLPMLKTCLIVIVDSEIKMFDSFPCLLALDVFFNILLKCFILLAFFFNLKTYDI